MVDVQLLPLVSSPCQSFRVKIDAVLHTGEGLQEGSPRDSGFKLDVALHMIRERML
jgi:hypothetical protein